MLCVLCCVVCGCVGGGSSALECRSSSTNTSAPKLDTYAIDFITFEQTHGTRRSHTPPPLQVLKKKENSSSSMKGSFEAGSYKHESSFRPLPHPASNYWPHTATAQRGRPVPVKRAAPGRPVRTRAEQGSSGDGRGGGAVVMGWSGKKRVLVVVVVVIVVGGAATCTRV